MMYIVKTILFVCSMVSLCKCFIEENTEKAYDYLFYSVVMFAIVCLVKPII